MTVSNWDKKQGIWKNLADFNAARLLIAEV